MIMIITKYFTLHLLPHNLRVNNVNKSQFEMALSTDKEKEIDMKDLCAKFTTDVIGSTAYGLNVNSLNNPNAEFRKYGKMIFDYGYIRGFEMLASFFFPNLARWTNLKTFGKDSSDFLREVFWKTMNQRMESGERRNDLIDILIDLKKTYSQQNIEGFGK